MFHPRPGPPGQHASGPRIRQHIAAAILALAVLGGCGIGPLPAVTASPEGSGMPTSPAPVPASVPASSSVSPTLPSPSFVRPTPTPEPSPVEYTVVAGDTLTSIARRFATTARSIAFWNRARYPSLDPASPGYAPDRIEVGWRLTIIPGVVVDETELTPPPASLSPTVLPSPIVVPGPTPLPGGSSLLVSHGDRASGAVALTFDMGGRLDPALAIMDWLIAHDVRATIFPTGKTGSETGIGRAVIGRIAAHPGLFGIGNHSWDHPDFRGLTAAQIADQLTRTEAALAPLAGRTTKPFFRPPFGSQDQAVLDAVGAAGWAYTIMWDVDTIDWRAPADGGPSAEDIVARVIARARGGSIVLMHLGGWHTLEALPGIVDGLRARGLEPVTLAELLGR